MNTDLIFRVDVSHAHTWDPLFCLFQGTHDGAKYVAHMITRRGLVAEITSLDIDEKFATALVQAEFKVWPPLETDQLCEMIWDKSLWSERDRWPELFHKEEIGHMRRKTLAALESND